MTDGLTTHLTALVTMAGIIAAFVGGLQKWTTLSPRVVALASMATGIGTGVLVQHSGLVALAGAATGIKATALSGAWGLLSSVAGKGLTSASALDAITGGKQT